MTEIERIQAARMYLKAMTDGYDPISRQPVPETDLIRNPHIVNCFKYISDILLACVQERQAAQQNRMAQTQPVPMPPPVPQTVQTPTPAPQTVQTPPPAPQEPEEPLRPFFLTDAQKKQLHCADEPLYLSQIIKILNRFTEENHTVPVKDSIIRTWLRSVGLLEAVDGKDTITEAGQQLGMINVETAHNRNGIMYSQNAQQFIIDNIDAVFAYQNSFCLTEEQRGQLTVAPERTVTEITIELNRFCEENGTNKLKATRITDWLVSQGLAQVIGRAKHPTQAGNAIGITERERTSEKDGRTFMQMYYNEQAQRYIFDHLDEILAQ